MRALGEMAGGVAHDFNNILSGILGRAQLLLMQLAQGPVKSGIEIIEKLTLDGAKTVRRIQELTRLRREQHFEAIDLPSLLEEALDLARMRWQSQIVAPGVQVQFDYQKELLPAIEGNTDELRETVANLLFNATDALPDGGSVSVSTRLEENHIFVEVRDDGIGMDEEAQKRAFEPFFTTKLYRGDGLGLSLVYSIMSRHGGEIVINSAVGKGTTAILVFPRDFRISQREAAARPQLYIDPSKFAILMIEDDDGVRDSVHELLVTRGHQVRSFANGREGLEAFFEQPSAIVITDLGMPEISGWEIAGGVKSHSPSTKVILMTGWGVNLDDHTVRASGIDYILSKPFQSTESFAAIDSVVVRDPSEVH